MGTGKRYVSIDALKALGVMYMVALHQTVWFFFRDDSGSLKFPGSENIVTGFSLSGMHFLALQLPLLAAVSYYFYVRRAGCTWMDIVRRAVFLCTLEFLKNLIAWGPDGIFTWDVLTFIALSMVVAYPFVKRVPRPWGLLSLGGLGFAALLLSDKFPFSRFMDGYWYRAVFGDAQGMSYWAFFPWFSLFAAGLFAGEALIRPAGRMMRALPWVGGGFLSVSIFTGNYMPRLVIDKVWGSSIFKPHPLFIVGVLGAGFLSIALAHRLIEGSRGLKALLVRSPFLNLGKGVLWIYLVTICVGYAVTTIATTVYIRNLAKAVVWWPVFVCAMLALSLGIGWLVSRKHRVEYV